MIYKTSLDNLAKAISTGISILFAAILYGHFVSIKEIGLFIPILLAIVLGGSYLLAFLYRPLHYELRGDILIVHRLLNDVIIQRVTIQSVELVAKEQLSSTVRVFGVGGLFGYFGKFSNKQMGSMQWYATRRDKTVLIKTIAGKKIIVTPDEATAFVNYFQQSLHE